MRPGLYLYHCVAAPAGLHIANGMYGQILVEPKGGLPKVDREFQIVQGEFYTTGSYGERGPQRFSMEKAIKEEPEYVVFNGQVGSLMGARALKAHAGERIRIYLGNAGPSLISSFHVVGEIFDAVYSEGGIVPNQNNVQTTIVPVGGSAMVEFAVDVPGAYTLVDHSMFRAFNKGAMGELRVDGKKNQWSSPGAPPNRSTTRARPSPRWWTRPRSLGSGPGARRGGAHEARESGVRARLTAVPPESGAGASGHVSSARELGFPDGGRKRAIDIVMNGLRGPIVVNGVKYTSEMPKPGLTNVESRGRAHVRAK